MKAEITIAYTFDAPHGLPGRFMHAGGPGTSFREGRLHPPHTAEMLPLTGPIPDLPSIRLVSSIQPGGKIFHVEAMKPGNHRREI